ncbi:DUF6456 domain-containing protein [Rhizobium wuzhouense]|uniref:DUF6456 domain-containing protein n=1 Tax=Rhizobium wuzhouense TaxID=1986026 RepID=UPI001FE0BFDB|nr:DUF6456 domain-containing protein [Rhizobium wuzhouense]
MTRNTDPASGPQPVSRPLTAAMPPARQTPLSALLDSAVGRHAHKRIRVLLRRALDGPILLTSEPCSAIVQSDPQLLDRLVAEGLLTRAHGHLHATPETAAYLRRALCDQAGDPFADQHRTLEPQTLVTQDGRQPVRRNLTESPLFPLLRLKEKDGRPFLTEDAVAAGDRLARDFDHGNLQPRITASWQPRLSSRVKGSAPAGPDLANSRIAARTRVNRAIEAMGPELAGVALDICCFGKGLETVERERQWPARSAKLMLRAALLALARHYTPPPPKPRTRHWGDEGFRPEIG